MFERFERPAKIICVGLAAWLAFQVAFLILRGDPLAHLKIPALPTLAEATNEPAKLPEKQTHAALAAKSPNDGTNSVNGTNVAANSTNADSGPRRGSQKPNAREGMPGPAPGMFPPMMGQMMGGGMKKIPLPPGVQARVDRIIDSEFLGPIPRPMPMALLGIAEHEAFIQATNGQIGPVKLGGEMGGIKLLRIGVNRVLVEQDGEKKELSIFGGVGGESLMPDASSAPSTNSTPTNTSAAHAPTNTVPTGKAALASAPTNQTFASKKKETP